LNHDATHDTPLASSYCRPWFDQWFSCKYTRTYPSIYGWLPPPLS